MAGGFLCVVPADAPQAGLRCLATRCSLIASQRFLQTAHADQPPVVEGPARRGPGLRRLRLHRDDEHCWIRSPGDCDSAFWCRRIAMRIRLEKLGLLLRDSSAPADSCRRCT